MQQWEYFSFRVSNMYDERAMQRKLDDLGTKGWELVSIVSTTGDMVFFFKRPK